MHSYIVFIFSIFSEISEANEKQNKVKHAFHIFSRLRISSSFIYSYSCLCLRNLIKKKHQENKKRNKLVWFW